MSIQDMQERKFNNQQWITNMKPKSGEFYTYRQLLAALLELDDESLDMTATVYDPNAKESYPVSECILTFGLPAEHRDEVDFEDDQPLLIIGPVEGL